MQTHMVECDYASRSLGGLMLNSTRDISENIVNDAKAVVRLSISFAATVSISVTMRCSGAVQGFESPYHIPTCESKGVC